MSLHLTPSQVLDVQTNLAKRALTTEFRDFARDIARAGQPGATMDPAPLIATLAKGAHTFHVTPEMTQVVEWAAEDLLDDIQFRRDLLPTEVGFAFFNTPITLNDPVNTHWGTHAFLWGPALNERGEGVTGIFLFNHTGDSTTYTSEARGATFTGRTLDYARRMFGPLVYVGHTYVADGEEVGPPLITIDDPVDGPIELTNIHRTIVAYMRLMQQKLVKPARVKPDRPAARRAARVLNEPRVTTVALRRVEYAGEPPEHETGRKYHHQWIVRGHSAWRHCGPDHPLAQKQDDGSFKAYVYIDAYVKGPKGTPLLMTEKVYSLQR